jgi:hypothetical protein
MVDTGMAFLTKLYEVAENDIKVLHDKGAAYGDSWKKRGGVGAFMMLARKWDRIENICRDKFGYDVIRACLENPYETESMLEQIADLRRYLALVQAEVEVLKNIEAKSKNMDFSKGPTITIENCVVLPGRENGPFQKDPIHDGFSFPPPPEPPGPPPPPLVTR